MSLLFCVFLYVPLELHTLPQHDALANNALLILVCNTKHICFCRESVIAASWQLELCLGNLAAGALSWELTSAMDEDCDWH